MIERTAVVTALCVGLLSLVLVGVSGAERIPEVSHDGLHLVKDAKVSVAYLKPGEDLSESRSCTARRSSSPTSPRRASIARTATWSGASCASFTRTAA